MSDEAMRREITNAVWDLPSAVLPAVLKNVRSYERKEHASTLVASEEENAWQYLLSMIRPSNGLFVSDDEAKMEYLTGKYAG